MEIVKVDKTSNEFISYSHIIVSEWGCSVLDDVAVRCEHDIHEPNIYLLIYDGDVLGGHVLHESQYGYFISYLIVRPVVRGKGYGSILLQHVAKIADEAQKDIQLYTDTWNKRSRNFYEKHGYIYLYDVDNVYPENIETEPEHTNAALYCRFWNDSLSIS